jgi:hypothetical protein
MTTAAPTVQAIPKRTSDWFVHHLLDIIFQVFYEVARVGQRLETPSDESHGLKNSCRFIAKP